MQYGRVEPREFGGLWYWDCYDLDGNIVRSSVIGYQNRELALLNFEQDYTDFAAIMRCRMP